MSEQQQEQEESKIDIPDEVKCFKLSDYIDNIQLIHNTDELPITNKDYFRHKFTITKGYIIGMVTVVFSTKEGFKVEFPLVKLGGLPMSNTVRLNYYNPDKGKCLDDVDLIVDFKKEVECSFFHRKKMNIKREIINNEN